MARMRNEDGVDIPLTPEEEALRDMEDAAPPTPPPTNDEIYDDVMRNQRVLKAFALCINDGTIVPGANVTPAALKAAVKAKM